MSSSNTYHKKKLIIILSRFPFPLEKGDKLRAYYQIVELSKFYNITLITTTDQKVHKSSIDKLKPFCTTIHIFKLSKISILVNTLFQFFTKKPFQIGYFYSSKINFTIQQILNEVKPDHIYCQLIRVSEYVKNYHSCSKTIDYMDALSKGIERRIEKAPIYSKWIFKLEAKKLAEYERKIFDYFENHVIISDQDRNYIIHPERKKIVCIPNGVDKSFFESIDKTNEFELLFIGNLSYAPNIEAVQYINKNILPYFNQQNKSIKLLISGATPTPLIHKIAQKNENIILTGWVNDIRNSYVRGKIFIAPMLIGTGLQNKLIEAMAMGIPCITTTLANNAIKAENEISIIVADSPDEFNRAIEKLLTNHQFYETIALNGKLHVLNNFNWVNSSIKLQELFNNK